MNIRYAQERDIPRLEELLVQVCNVHHAGRPDLFRAGGQKYDRRQLLATGIAPFWWRRTGRTGWWATPSAFSRSTGGSASART